MTAASYLMMDLSAPGCCSGNFLVADTLTIDDISLYGYTHVAHECGFDLGRYPGIQAWLKRISTQPGYLSMEQD